MPEMSNDATSASSSPPHSPSNRPSRLLALGPLLIGATVLLSWMLGLPGLQTVLPGLTSMKANTALGLSTAGAGLLLLPGKLGPMSSWRRVLSIALGSVALLLGTLTLLEYAMQTSLGLDEMLFADPATTPMSYPGRMSMATAAGLAGAGAAVILLLQAMALPNTPRRRRTLATSAAHLLAIVPGGVAYLSLVGETYRLDGLHSVAAFVLVPVHTATAFALLAAAISLTAPSLGWRRGFLGHSLARSTLMRLLPLALLLPFLAGQFVNWSVSDDAYKLLHGSALIVLFTATASVVMAWSAAFLVGRTERALRDGEARLRLALEAGDLAAFDWDLQADVVRPSASIREIFGFALGEGECSTDYFARMLPEDIARTRADVGQGIAAGRLRCSYRIRLPHGALRHVLVRGDVFRDEDGTAERILGVVTDETERENREAALRESEARFRQMADAVPQIVWIYNAEGFIEFFNRQWLDYTGADAPADTTHQVIANYLHCDDAALTTASIEKAERTGSPFLFEHRIRSRHGDHRWFLVRGQPCRDPSTNGIVRWYGTSTDIHDRKLAEERLRHSEQRLNALVRAASEVLYTMSPDWSEMREISGGRFLSDAVVPNRAWLDDYIHPEDRDRVMAMVQEAIEREGIFELEHRVRRIDGSWGWVMSRAIPLLDTAGRISEWFGATTDVTARKEAEDALRQVNETLEATVAARTMALSEAVSALRVEAQERERVEDTLRQAQKMDAVGQLTGGLAHDFNNLLTSISNSLELMQRRTNQSPPEDLKRYTDLAMSATKRAAALTHRLLAFSRRQTLDPRATDVNRLVVDLEDLIRRTVGPAIDLEVVCADDLWSTLVDPNQLENSLLNLCVNARDAMPYGGHITVETSNHRFDEVEAREQELSPGEYVSLCVRDTGAGFAQDVITRAFDPFFTTKPIGMGTGLGLSMVYGFARQSGGRARIFSQPGRGAAVCIYLSRHLGEARRPDTPVDPASASPGDRSETILVVDDEETIRTLAAEILTHFGYSVLVAAEGTAALRLLQSDARIDLLLTDVGMPGMNGRQLADAARQDRPDLPVLFITGYAEGGVLSHRNLGPDMHVMTKPFAMDALVSRVGQLIVGESASG
jgi:PAS domain S-box-containing protein